MFIARTKMADLVATNHQLILFLPRLGIPLGFAERTVQEVCEQVGVDTEFVLMLANVCTFETFRPTAEQLSVIDMRGLVPFLRCSHHYYLDNRLPHILCHLEEVVKTVPTPVETVLRKFYSDYQRQLSDHFLLEEREVFPYLEACLSAPEGSGKKGTKAMRFVKKHEEIEDSLSDLVSLVYKYFPQQHVSDDCLELLFDILQVSDDLHKHVLIEERILLPYIAGLEGRL